MHCALPHRTTTAPSWSCAGDDTDTGNYFVMEEITWPTSGALLLIDQSDNLFGPGDSVVAVVLVTQ